MKRWEDDDRLTLYDLLGSCALGVILWIYLVVLWIALS